MFKNRHFFLSFSLVFLLAGCFCYLGYDKYFLEEGKQQRSEEEEEGGIPLRDRMDLAWKQEFELTKDLALNDVPRERLITAYNYAQQLRAQSSGNKITGAIAGVNWTERGPNNFGGRTRAIMIDPNDATKKNSMGCRSGWRHLEDNKHYRCFTYLDSCQ